MCFPSGNVQLEVVACVFTEMKVQNAFTHPVFPELPVHDSIRSKRD